MKVTVPVELKSVLSIDPEVMGGDICFIGTRIPVVILLDNIQAGVTLDEFFENYPDLTREQVQAVMDWEHQKAYEALGLELAS